MADLPPFDPDLRHTLTPRTATALRGARTAAGLGRGRAARLAGISPSYLDKLEHGERAPSTAVAEALIIALNLPPDIAYALRTEAIPDVGRDKEPT